MLSVPISNAYKIEQKIIQIYPHLKTVISVWAAFIVEPQNNWESQALICPKI